MSEFEKKIVKGCVVFIAVLFLLLAASAFAQDAVIVPPAPAGQWGVERAYITTSPTGQRWACKLGEYEEPLPANIVFMDCVPWRMIDQKSYYALPNGSITRRIQ